MVERKAHKKIDNTQHKRTWKPLPIALIIALSIVVVVLAQANPFQRTTLTKGSVAYTDTVGCDIYFRNRTSVTTIDWGVLSPDSLTYQDFLLVNTGTVNATMVRTISGWSVNSSYFQVSWNISSTTPFPPNVYMPCRIYLRVFGNITSSVPRITTFAFNMTITAYGG